MGQWDILEYLERRKGEEFTIRELHLTLKMAQNSVSRLVTQLQKYGFVEVVIKKIHPADVHKKRLVKYKGRVI